MKKSIIAIAALTLSATSIAADGKHTDTGFRLGAGYTGASIFNSDIEPSGFVLTAGYDFNKVLGLSANYSNFSESIGIYTFDASSVGIDADIGWTFVSKDREISTKIYGIAGVNRTSVDEEATFTSCGYYSCYTYTDTASTSENFIRIGVGTRVTFQDKFGVTLQYVENYWTEDTELGYSQVDVIGSYKF